MTTRSRIARDFALNTVASVLLVTAIQLIAYPTLARTFSAGQYGVILTLMGIVNVVGVSMGSALDNSRILLQREYESSGSPGDYNLIFVGLAIAAATIVSSVLSLLNIAEAKDVLGCTVIVLLVLFRSYYSVSYRIRIDYRRVLVASVFGVLGYGIGLWLSVVTGWWGWTFIVGEMSACLYVGFTSHIITEGFGISGLFSHSVRKFGYLWGANLVASSMVYLDRFLIFPLLGSSEVSVYSAASVLGKSMGLVVAPIAGVLLTYFAKRIHLARRDFISQMCWLGLASVASYGAILLVGRSLTVLLYPTLAADAMRYFAIANLASLVFVAGTLVQPTLLRFAGSHWQPLLQAGHLMLYCVCAVVGLRSAGLLGFCWGALAANTVKLAVMVSLGVASLPRVTQSHESEAPRV